MEQWLPLVERGRMGGLLFNGDRVSVGDDEKVLKMNSGDS